MPGARGSPRQVPTGSECSEPQSPTGQVTFWSARGQTPARGSGIMQELIPSQYAGKEGILQLGFPRSWFGMGGGKAVAHTCRAPDRTGFPREAEGQRPEKPGKPREGRPTHLDRTSTDCCVARVLLSCPPYKRVWI